MKSKVKELREKYGLTQAMLSKKYGIPKRTIENWEEGSRKPPEYVVNLIESALDAEFPDFTDKNVITKESL